ncbi:PilW family protein [Cognatiluteimonas weifangensis]|uniref:Prepilin-type N-terminal cleavage/methylation domain-containing protein n=1 Tax=Cognatiluteimonas weifangensis TaxID=2303539 RepID=A0A372DS14_9GAMM|nr:prepilin-type N-terminal cleavage/methylation domain-containing protein [Luteimonas weifangensis]RFP62358.1 prepilin-type N-terminal cleavage/methylation domain-containing protein [Luteimonas weifangensis]
MLMRSFRDSRRAGGFTLVELMVALVVGLIVVLAAVGFVVSVAKANSENIQVTRLTQELRSLTDVMARDIRRARYVVDPAGLVGAGPAAIDHDAIYPALADGPQSCIQYSYDNPPNLPISTLSHRIRLVGTDVVLKTDADPTAACASTSDGSKLNSSEVQITQLRFNPTSDSSYDIVVKGKLANAPAGSTLAAIEREFRETVFVRSGPVN